jgi:hypothetical protein
LAEAGLLRGRRATTHSQVTIRRLVKGATVRIVADLDMKLRSGDSVEVVTTVATSRTAGRKESLGHASRASKDAAADMRGALDEHVELRHPV